VTKMMGSPKELGKRWGGLFSGQWLKNGVPARRESAVCKAPATCGREGREELLKWEKDCRPHGDGGKKVKEIIGGSGERKRATTGSSGPQKGKIKVGTRQGLFLKEGLL